MRHADHPGLDVDDPWQAVEACFAAGWTDGLHVARGFRAEQSAVTVFAAESGFVDEVAPAMALPAAVARVP